MVTTSSEGHIDGEGLESELNNSVWVLGVNGCEAFAIWGLGVVFIRYPHTNSISLSSC